MKYTHKIPLAMFSLMLIMLTCIPREDPPEKTQVLEQINVLPESLNENSGMIESGTLIWFINDSGDEPVLYGYDRTQNTVVKEVVVRNTINTDWEDITQNENYIFIGDFGNNSGSRADLRVIRIDKPDLVTEADTIDPSGLIEFSYEDQTNFSWPQEKTPYDCEAFIATDDSLVLFTKDWVTRETRLYTIPVTPGNYSATFRKKWQVDGLITAAAFSDESNQLLLLGYTPATPFLWTYSDFDAQTLTFGEGKRSDFSFIGLQTEGVLITADGSILISSEENTFSNTPASLYSVDWDY